MWSVLPTGRVTEPFPYEMRRFCHTVGRDNTRYHLVSPGSDASLCGKDVRSFNCELAAGYEQQIIDAGQVCARCKAKS